MIRIHLHNLKFRAFHGLYEEEQLIGNDYEVNLEVSYEPRVLPVKNIDDTVDYTQLYELLKERMARPCPLLETLVTEIGSDIQARYPLVSKISVSIKKLSPPINNFEGAVGVSFEWNK